jgi:periplasmic divalent cation tolerance protein
MRDEVCAVVITAPDADWLATLVRSLVEQRLCASGHIANTIRSIYRWQGEIEDRPEAHVTLHTRTNLVPAIVDQTNARHPCVVPCAAATPIVAANPAYRQWLLDETRESARERPRVRLENSATKACSSAYPPFA